MIIIITHYNNISLLKRPFYAVPLDNLNKLADNTSVLFTCVFFTGLTTFTFIEVLGKVFVNCMCVNCKCTLIFYKLKFIVSDLSSIVYNAEISVVLEFLGFLELGVCSLLLNHFLHKALVCGFGEPALLIQQRQDARRAGL